MRSVLLSIPTAVTEERNSLGHTVLHLASEWPVGLKLLLDAGGAKIVNVPSLYGDIPLIYALSVHCIESVALLVNAGSALSSPMWSGSYQDASEEALDWSSLQHEVEIKIISAKLRQRRRRLRILAQQALPPDVLERLRVPDSAIVEGMSLHLLISTLDEHRIAIPQELRPPKSEATVYHLLAESVGRDGWENVSPQKLFDEGFCCVDELSHRGLTPLACIDPRSLTQLSVALSYAQWIINRGANLGKIQACSTVATTAAHCLAFNLGTSMTTECMWGPDSNIFREPAKVEASFWGDVDALDSASTQFLHDLCLDATCDECSCTCSSAGCTPLILLLKAIKYKFSSSYTFASSKHELVQVLLVEWIEKVGQSQSGRSTGVDCLALAEQVLRFATHQRLGLSHSCCDGERGFPSRETRGSLRPVRDQSEALLLIPKHQALTLEYVEEYQRQGKSLSSFMKGYWKEQVDRFMSDK